MRSVSNGSTEDYYAARAANGRIHFKMEFESGTVLTDDDIDISVGVTITNSYNGDTDLKIGKAPCKQLSTRIILSERTQSINWGGRFLVWFGIEDEEEEILWVNYGTFVGKRPKNVSSVDAIEFTAYDQLTLLDQSADEFIDDLTFPKTTAEILQAVAEEVGLTFVEQQSLTDMSDRRFGNNHFKNESYTYREIVEDIAEAVGCYMKILPTTNAIGSDWVVTDWFSGAWNGNEMVLIPRDEQFYEEHADLYAGMIWDEFDELTLAEQEAMTWDDASGYYKNRNAFDGIVVSKVDNGVTGKYPNKCTGHLYKVKDNPILIITSANKTTHINTYVKPLYERIQALGGVLPMTVECLGDLLTEAGDIIQVELPEGIVEMPVYYKTTHWNGILTDKYETTAPES